MLFKFTFRSLLCAMMAEISQPGVARITARAADKAGWQALNLCDVQLLPVQKE
jgi:hypothetical protein